MELQERQIGNVVVLDISGQLKVADGSERLMDKINSLLYEGSRNILLNLDDVSYIDSEGLGQLVSSFTSVTRENGSLKLLNVGKRTKDLLAMTKLLTVFDTYDTEHQAVDSFAAEAGERGPVSQRHG